MPYDDLSFYQKTAEENYTNRVTLCFFQIILSRTGHSEILTSQLAGIRGARFKNRTGYCCQSKISANVNYISINGWN